MSSIKKIECQNIIAYNGDYFIECHLVKSDVVFVTFESAGPPIVRPDMFRAGWGANLLRRLGISVISIKPRKTDWYQKESFTPILNEAARYASSYPRVVTYGGSMGGFAALAFSDSLGGTEVISINPQSSLRRELVPWDKRFPIAGEEDWNGPYSDAVGGYQSATTAYVVVDRYLKADMLHVNRLDSRNLKVLNVPFVGHHLPAHLARMGALKYIVATIAQDRFCSHEFYQIIRARRNLNRYRNTMVDRAKSNFRKSIVMAYFEDKMLEGME